MAKCEPISTSKCTEQFSFFFCCWNNEMNILAPEMKWVHFQLSTFRTVMSRTVAYKHISSSITFQARAICPNCFHFIPLCFSMMALFLFTIKHILQEISIDRLIDIHFSQARIFTLLLFYLLLFRLFCNSIESR